MTDEVFKAYVVRQTDKGYKGTLESKKINELPSGDILVKVQYSSLNYKDALSATGNNGVTKKYPHTPGIDAAGVVANSDNSRFLPGDNVIVTSYDLGMNTDGGWAEYIRVPSEWAVKLPAQLSMKEAMIYGTAGLTAGMSVLRLTENVESGDGKIVVTGSTGGVGTHCVAILSKLGYSVTAVTGKESERTFLSSLGAEEIITRKDLENQNQKPLLKPVYAGAVDTVGGVILENILKSMLPLGTVTCCGNAASPELDLTVFPFILRGISLIGIDSQNYPMKYREQVWEKLSSDWKPSALMEIYEEVSLSEVEKKIKLMLQGKSKGRIIINLKNTEV